MMDRNYNMMRMATTQLKMHKNAEITVSASIISNDLSDIGAHHGVTFTTHFSFA